MIFSRSLKNNFLLNDKVEDSESKKGKLFLFKKKNWWENNGNFFPTPYAIIANLIGHIGFVNCQIIASASISRKKTSFAVIIFGKYLEVIDMYSRLKSQSINLKIFSGVGEAPPKLRVAGRLSKKLGK